MVSVRWWELASVVERDAEQLGDHERGHLAGDVGDGVALAPSILASMISAAGAPRCAAAVLPPPGVNCAVDDAAAAWRGGSDVIINLVVAEVDGRCPG
jgi:hypothetical protein